MTHLAEHLVHTPQAGATGEVAVRGPRRTRVASTPDKHIRLKCENEQVSGSFKYRGAVNALRCCRRQPIVTASSGNHALALAEAIERPDQLTVVMQHTASPHKKQLLRQRGVDVVTCDGSTSDRNRVARELASARGAHMIPSSDHPAVIAGQATVAAEISEQCPESQYIFVPVGGGGLAAGCVTELTGSQIGVIGVEPSGAADAQLSLLIGQRVRLDDVVTICDGVRHASLGDLTYPIIAEGIEDIVVVEDADVIEAQRALAAIGIVAEPTGALAYAGALRHTRPASVAVISGGNITH